MQKESILLIEDDEDTRSLLEFLFRRADFDIVLAIDGDQALGKINTCSPTSMILLDIMMPYYDGFEILESIKLNALWKDVPVIVLTSNDNDDDRLRGFEFGIAAYITKPFNPDELVAQVRRAIAGSV